MAVLMTLLLTESVEKEKLDLFQSIICDKNGGIELSSKMLKRRLGAIILLPREKGML
jgi:hypothetical protein